MKLGGLEWGLVLGARLVDTLVGVMSDRALAQLTRGAKLAFTAEAAEALPDGDLAPSAELFFTNLDDWSSISVSKGFMVDLAVEGKRIMMMEGTFTCFKLRNRHGPRQQAEGARTCAPQGWC